MRELKKVRKESEGIFAAQVKSFDWLRNREE
jgi:hypothetical protein